MNINLTKLITNLTDEIKIDDEVTIDDKLLENTDIKKISKVKVKGNIYPEGSNFSINLNIKCVNDLNRKNTNLIITCKDTGRGIKEENIHINRQYLKIAIFR